MGKDETFGKINEMEVINKNNGLLKNLLDESILYVNYKIQNRDWHDNFADPKDIKENYFAIIIKPYNKYPAHIIEATVNEFNKKGWNLIWRKCYDARGPHLCYYVAKTDIYK